MNCDKNKATVYQGGGGVEKVQNLVHVVSETPACKNSKKLNGKGFRGYQIDLIQTGNFFWQKEEIVNFNIFPLTSIPIQQQKSNAHKMKENST